MPPPSPRRHAEHAADGRVTWLDRVLGSAFFLGLFVGLPWGLVWLLDRVAGRGW